MKYTLVFVALIAIGAIASWLFFRKNHRDVDAAYVDLRQMILNLKSESMPESERDGSIYAALVDMDMGKAVVSLVSVADGTTSLYFSSGGGQLGLGNAHEQVREATKDFLRDAERTLSGMASATDFSLPDNQRHVVYLLTDNGIFRQEIDVQKINSAPQTTQFLFSLYNNVISRIREAQ